ncbi:MAG: cytidylyltransferase domain-containing protein [Clostridium sp.]
MKVVCVVQARMSSSRLPGKVLMKIEGVSILEHIIRRLKKSEEIDEIIIATTENKEDDKIEELVRNLDTKIFRGNLFNVLERYYFAVRERSEKILIRITGDCPCVDYKLIDDMVRAFKEEYIQNRIEYMNNTFENNYPRGYDVEIFTKKALEKAYYNAEKDYEKEHVTPYLYDKENNFKIKIYKGEKIYPNYRVTVDTTEDFQVVENIFKNLYRENPYFGIEAVVNYLNKNNQVLDINSKVKQKKLGE